MRYVVRLKEPSYFCHDFVADNVEHLSARLLHGKDEKIVSNSNTFLIVIVGEALVTL